jgi:hemolysin activation/secretion protein
LQIATEPLLGIEQFTIGSRYTVRGYPQNAVVRDNGVIGSLELRIPVLRNPDETPLLELTPFAEVGHGWEAKGRRLGSKTLTSLGIGLRWAPTDWMSVDLQWGHAFADTLSSPDWDLQGEGVYFAVRIRRP